MRHIPLCLNISPFLLQDYTITELELDRIVVLVVCVHNSYVTVFILIIIKIQIDLSH